jgi:hypothetical protein
MPRTDTEVPFNAALRKEVRRPTDCVWPDQIVGQRPVSGPERKLGPLSGRRYSPQIKVAACRLIFRNHDTIDNGPVNDTPVLFSGREQDRHLLVSLFRLGPEPTASNPAFMLNKLMSLADAGLRCQDARMPEGMDAVAGTVTHTYTFPRFDAALKPNGRRASRSATHDHLSTRGEHAHAASNGFL